MDNRVSGAYAYHDHELHPDPPHQSMYLRKVLQYLEAEPSVRKVLDAGCGDGNFAVSTAGAGYEMYGIDMSASGIKVAQGRGVGASLRHPFMTTSRRPSRMWMPSMRS
jgi:2-polyprenyl-3-methyl-5-hydroxy-6-metoxy-1,4-benzoquinol methylase